MTEHDVINVVYALSHARGISPVTASTYMFGDGNVLAKLENGSTITIRRARQGFVKAREYWPAEKIVPSIVRNA